MQPGLILIWSNGSIISIKFQTMNTAKSIKPQQSNPQLSYRYKRIKEYVYDMQRVLGKGNFSTVYRGVNQDKTQDVAVKVIKLNSLTFQKLEELLEQEIAISRVLDHENTIHCYQVLKSVNHCYFITELCEEGTLEGRLKQRGGQLSEDQIWTYVKDVYEGLRYLGSKNIVHRDIKLANIFVKNGRAKIADFGFAVYAKQSFQDVNIGSPLYMSPQGYISHSYGPKTDVWAFGLVIYQLLHGKAPLHHIGSQQELKKELKVPIKNEQFRSDISSELRDLIKRCLDVNEKSRISIEQISKHPYMQRSKEQSMGDIKNSVQRFRRLSVPTNMQFTRTTLKAIDQRNKQNIGSDKKAKGAEKRVSINSFMTYKELPTPTRIQKLNSDEIEQNTSITHDYRDEDLLSTNITFNQSIGLIHYCRIGYKLTEEAIPIDTKKVIKSMVLKILNEIKIKITQNMIIYTDSENREKKENKLRLVVTEYMAKYSKEMAGECTTVVLPHLQDQLRRHLEECERTLDKKLVHSYLCMLFMMFTGCLFSALKSKRYNFFGENGLLDSCLQQDRLPTTNEGYFSAKEKYEQHYQNSVNI